jgi:hypothetical protein
MKLEYKGHLTAAIVDALPGWGAITDGLTSRAIADRLDHSYAWVSGILARLAKQGRVSRGRDSEGVWRYSKPRPELTRTSGAASLE